MICKKVCVYPLENKPLQFLKKTPNGHAKIIIKYGSKNLY